MRNISYFFNIVVGSTDEVGRAVLTLLLPFNLERLTQPFKDHWSVDPLTLTPSNAYTVKKVTNFPVPRRDLTNQTLVASRLGTGKSLTFFLQYMLTLHK
jgi:hypothetical protein